MRNYIFALACLSLFACAWAYEVTIGKSVPGETLDYIGFITKYAEPGIRRNATFNVTAPDGKVLSRVLIRTRDGTPTVEIEIINGSIGMQNMTLLAIGERSRALKLAVYILVIDPTELGTTVPTSSEPSSATPSSTEPSSAESSPTIPSGGESCPTEPSSAEPSSTEPSSEEPSSTEPSSGEPSSTEPSSAEPSSTEPSSAEPSSTEPSRGEPTSTEPNSGEPSSTEPSSGEPSSTEPSNAASTVFFNLQFLYVFVIWLYH